MPGTLGIKMKIKEINEILNTFKEIMMVNQEKYPDMDINAVALIYLLEKKDRGLKPFFTMRTQGDFTCVIIMFANTLKVIAKNYNISVQDIIDALQSTFPIIPD